MKVLIVDDHALFREGLVGLFKAQPDFEVVGEASTVREAVAAAQKLKPDITLMDFTLPDGTGVDAAREILRDSPQAKIVFLTLYDSDDHLFSALRGGAKGFLPKSTPVLTLLTSLRAVCSGEAALSGDLINRVLEEYSHPRQSKPLEDRMDDLTFRELEILQHLTTGATNREIARRLVITENTVKNHVHNILDKLNLKNRREAVNFARQHGLINQAAYAEVNPLTS